MAHQSKSRGRLDLRRTLGLMLILGMLAAFAVPLALAAPPAQEANVLRIGYLGAEGSDLANGIQMAIDEINSTVGVESSVDGTTYSLELITLDATPTPESLATDARTLVEAGAVVIFGPDTNSPLTPANLQDLLALEVSILTGATLDNLTDSDLANWIFRIRAPERVYAAALMTYLTTDLSLTSIALVQTDVVFTEALIDFETVLTSAGLSPADKIQLTSGDTLGQEVERLINVNPEAIVFWGPPEDAVTLLTALRENNWTGQFAYPLADELARTDVLSDDLAAGMLGVTSWIYSYPGRLSRIFTRDYLSTFGDIPGPLAYAGYDLTWYLRNVMENQGVTPSAIQAGLAAGLPLPLVEGTIHPVDFGNGDLIRFAIVYQLGQHGGPQVVALFDDTTRLSIEVAGQEVAQAQTPPPTIVPGPPTETPFPTATFEGTWVRVTARTLNVRTGPGFNYDKIGEVHAGDTMRVLGAVADYSWLVVDFHGGVGWVKTEYTEVIGDLVTVAVVPPPPSPTPAASPTPSLAPNPDIVIDSVVLSPPQPIPGKPFTATVTVRNAGGGAAGRFAVAATFQPGEVFTSAFVEGLAGGTTAQTQLSGTLSGTGVFQITVVADLNNEVGEGNEGNNTFNITYRADYPLLAQQSSLQVNSGQTIDLWGGTPDFVWDGFNIGMQNGATVGILGGVTFENAHYDLITPGVANNTIGLTTDQVNPGVVLGMITAEGKRAAIRIDNRSGNTIWISYRVYNDTP